MSHDAILEIPNVVIISGPAGPQGVQGPEGDQGPQGIQGPQGKGWLFGDGVPSPVLGVDGDSYVENTTRQIYFKTAGAWSDTGQTIASAAELQALKNAAEAAAGAAAGSAGAAAGSAGNAAASEIAGASSAATSATNAGLTAADRIATAADAVSAAASAALAEAAIGGVIYDTTALGLAATVDGQLFIVKGDGISTYALMYKNVAGVAT
ncbi:MAG: hypothetical protein EOR23_33860, partial [Mesorhizobium sp.]